LFLARFGPCVKQDGAPPTRYPGCPAGAALRA